MAAYLICLTAGGGVPLFYRTRGNLKQLPFPVMGSLNGVHMFASTHQVELLASSTSDAKVVWKDYYNSLTLILITEDDRCCKDHVTRLLDMIFQAMVLLYGFDDLTNIKNLERFKREIKVCFSLIDSLLDRFETDSYSDLTQCVSVTLSQESHVLQTYLEAFAEAASSPYGCLQVSGQVAVATSMWWQLHAQELILLSRLIASAPPSSSRDLPVFLPVKSPNVPHRLLTFQLIPGVEVCIVCGPTPALSELEREVGRYWRPVLDSLKTVVAQHPRNLPSSLAIDQGILGLLLVNREKNRCLSYTGPQEETRKRKGSSSLSPVDRRRALRQLYTSVVGNIFPLPPSQKSPQGDADRLSEALVHEAKETYTVSPSHKCYAIRSPPHELYILFDNTVPTYALRSLSQKSLAVLTQEKHMTL